MVLLALSWVGFLALLVGREMLLERRTMPRNAIHLVASALLAAGAVGVLRTPEMARSLSLLGFTPRQMAVGASDEYRSRVWSSALESVTDVVALPLSSGTIRIGTTHQEPGRAIDPAANAISAPASTKKTDSAPASPATRDSSPKQYALHNVYLEFLRYGGVASVAGLILVLGLLSGLSVRYAWQMRHTPAFPFASALTLAIFFIAAINYGNVTLHLTFIWVLFGFVTACISPRYRTGYRSEWTSSAAGLLEGRS